MTLIFFPYKFQVIYGRSGYSHFHSVIVLFHTKKQKNWDHKFQVFVFLWDWSAPFDAPALAKRPPHASTRTNTYRLWASGRPSTQTRKQKTTNKKKTGLKRKTEAWRKPLLSTRFFFSVRKKKTLMLAGLPAPSSVREQSPILLLERRLVHIWRPNPTSRLQICVVFFPVPYTTGSL